MKYLIGLGVFLGAIVTASFAIAERPLRDDLPLGSEVIVAILKSSFDQCAA